MKKASIIGLGDTLKGDFCAGSCIIDALSQERLGDSVYLAYLGGNASYVGGLVYDTDFAVIVGALNIGGPAGMVHYWDLRIFQQNAAWLAHEFRTIGSIVNALGWSAFAGRFPESLLFLWIEPKVTEGFGISREVQTGLRAAIRIIKRNLIERAFVPDSASKISSICQVEPFLARSIRPRSNKRRVMIKSPTLE